MVVGDSFATGTRGGIGEAPTGTGRVMAALATPDLSTFQQLVYAVLVGRADGNSCRLTIQAIADNISRSGQRANVYRALESLEQKHLVHAEPVAHGVSRYHLLDPLVRSGLSTTELAGADV